MRRRGFGALDRFACQQREPLGHLSSTGVVIGEVVLVRRAVFGVVDEIVKQCVQGAAPRPVDRFDSCRFRARQA